LSTSLMNAITKVTRK